MSDQTVTAEAVFDALGDPVRRRILELLRDGASPVGQLAERLPVGRPAVSKHLRTLRAAGLLTYRTAGTRNLYALAPEGLTAAQQWLVSTWDVALQSYAEAVRESVGEDTAPPRVRSTSRRKP
jgi:DNA-binding transcriptional ArsR family regulator